jgi:murein DD-endopeptidase MepM/ murein hydrolase activator NlpD
MDYLRSFASLALLCIIFVTHGGHVYAQSVDSLQASANALTLQMQALNKEITEYNKKISNTQGQAKTLKQALAALELQRASLSKQIDKTELEITQAQAQIASTQSKIVQTQTVVERNQEALQSLLRSVAETEASSSLLRSLLTTGAHISDTVDVIKRGEDVSKAVGERVKSLQEAKNILMTNKQVYESNKVKLKSLRTTLTDQEELVKQTTKDKSDLLTQTKNKESEYQQLLADRKRKKTELEQEILDVEAKLKTVVDGSKIPKYGTGVLKYPVDKVTITQYFGNTPFVSKNPQVYNGAGHNGIDFAARVGTPIYAAEAGTVLGVGNTDASCVGVSYGKWVLIRHDNGLTTLYAHLSVISVQEGDSVTARQKIALSGNTGYSTGPHLHFTVLASDAVHISGPTEYKSKVCGTYMVLPLAPRAGYLNPLSYF